jgi:hypothetical protein
MSAACFKREFATKKSEIEEDDDDDFCGGGSAENTFALKVKGKAGEYWKKHEESSFTFLVTRKRRKIIVGIVILDKISEPDDASPGSLCAAGSLAAEFLASCHIGELQK